MFIWKLLLSSGAAAAYDIAANEYRLQSNSVRADSRTNVGRT